jgi:hypothetical protein
MSALHSTASHCAGDIALGRCERALEQTLGAVLGPDPSALPLACEQLQQAMRDCLHAQETGWPQDSITQHRWRAVGAGLARLQRAVVRSGAQVSKQLQVLLPPQELSTYGRSSMASGRSKTSAAFTSLSA